MTLTIKDRLSLLSILPQQGDITTLRLIQNLRAALSFSEEDHARLKLKVVEQNVEWDADAPQEAEIEIGPKATVLIQETLKTLSGKKSLHADYLPLWDKFNPETAA